MLSCKEVSRLVSESLDRRLPIRQRLAIRMHLLFCRSCTQFRRQLLLIKDAVGHLQDDIEKAVSSSPLTQEARERMKKTLRLAAGDTSLDEL